MEACHDVQVEPHLPCLVRLCITVQLCLMIMPGCISEHLVFGSAYIIAPFFDVHIFNPFAASNRSTTLAATFRRHEAEKCHAYEERIREVGAWQLYPISFFFLRWNGECSHYHLQCINIWLNYLVRSGVPHIQW